MYDEEMYEAELYEAYLAYLKHRQRRAMIAQADFFGCSLNDLTGFVKMPSKADALHDTRDFLSSTDEASEEEGR